MHLHRHLMGRGHCPLKNIFRGYIVLGDGEAMNDSMFMEGIVMDTQESDQRLCELPVKLRATHVSRPILNLP